MRKLAVSNRTQVAIAYSRLAQSGAKKDAEKKALFQQSVDEFTQAVRLRADWAEAHNNLGVALGSQGRFKEAVGEHLEALRLKPDYAGALFNLAYAYRKSGDKKKAMETYEKLNAVDPAMAAKLLEGIK